MYLFKISYPDVTFLVIAKFSFMCVWNKEKITIIHHQELKLLKFLFGCVKCSIINAKYIKHYVHYTIRILKYYIMLHRDRLNHNLHSTGFEF